MLHCIPDYTVIIINFILARCPPKQQQQQQQHQQEQEEQEEQEQLPSRSISGPDHNGKCVSDSFNRWEGIHSLGLSIGLCNTSSTILQGKSTKVIRSCAVLV